MPGADKLVTFQGENGNLTRPLWDFKPRGQSGKMISDLLPHLAELADDLCFIHSMTAKTNTHGPAENQMSTGFTLDGFPSMGSWVSYALGTENQDLPAFVAIPDPRGVPQVGPNHWNSRLPAGRVPGHRLQCRQADPQPGHARRRFPPRPKRARAIFCRLLNDRHLARAPGRHRAERAHRQLRTGRQDAAAAPPRSAISARKARPRWSSTAPTTRNKLKAGFARNCLLARRLLERGVRFVQLFNGAYAMGEGVGNWDGHKTLKDQYDIHAPDPRPAVRRAAQGPEGRAGCSSDTLVVWVTEFGRMPTFQKGASGRDHNPHGFTVWLAGAGVKRGFSYGATDEFGYQAVENVATHLRSARHDPAPARARPRAAELLPQRHRAPPDRCAWRSADRHSGIGLRVPPLQQRADGWRVVGGDGPACLPAVKQPILYLQVPDPRVNR